jgi:glycine/D-amino acid oxidase-like deaminating enzyme
VSISYWLDESQILKSTSSKKYDYVVIGAGIAGLSTAYWLEKKSPNSKIAVIDKFSLAYGASGRNAGFVTCGSALHFNQLNEKFGLTKAQEIWKFSEINRELLLEEIIQDQTKSVDYKSTGSCTVIPDGSYSERFELILKSMQQSNIAVDMIDAWTLQKEYAVKSSAGAIEYKYDGVIHPVKLLKQIQIKLKNTDFIFGQEVFKIQSGDNEVLVATQKQVYQAAKTFVCLNGFVSQLLPEFNEIIKPQRGQIIMTKAIPQMIKGPCYLTQHLCYFRQLPTGEILIGGFRNHDAENENTAHDQTTEKIQSALENFVKTYFANTANIEINYRWSGIMGFSPDEQMVVGELPQRKNIHIMAGCSGHGMGLSFHAAKKMVDNSFGEKLPSHLDMARLKMI